MIIWSLLFLACSSSTSVHETIKKSEQTPIFVDLDGQNWRYPVSSIGIQKERISDPELKEGNRRYLEGEYTKAAQLIIPYIREHPEDAVAHAILAACFFRLNDLGQAEKAAKNAILHDPSVVSYSNLGSILAGKGNIDDAIIAYEQARILDPKHFLPIRNLVTLYYNIRNLEQAEELLYKLIQIDPTDSYGYVSLGQVLVEQNRLQEAEIIYRFRLEDLNVTPATERYLAGGLMLDLPLALANILLHQKEYREAEQYFQQTLSLSFTAQSTWASANIYRKKAYTGLVKIYMATGEKEKEEEARLRYHKIRKEP